MNDWWKTCSRLIYESRNSCKSQKFRKWLRARDWHGLQKDKLEFGKYLWCIVLLPTHLNLPERFRSVFGFFWIKKPNFLKLFSPKNIYIKIHYIYIYIYIYIYPFLIPKHKQIRLKKKSNQRTLSSFDLYFFLKNKNFKSSSWNSTVQSSLLIILILILFMAKMLSTNPFLLLFFYGFLDLASNYMVVIPIY